MGCPMEQQVLSRQRDEYTVLLWRPRRRGLAYRFSGEQGFSNATGSEEEPDDLGGRTSELRRTFTRRCRHIPLAPSAFWLPAPSQSFGRRRWIGQRAVGRPRFVVVTRAHSDFGFYLNSYRRAPNYLLPILFIYSYYLYDGVSSLKSQLNIKIKSSKLCFGITLFAFFTYITYGYSIIIL